MSDYVGTSIHPTEVVKGTRFHPTEEEIVGTYVLGANRGVKKVFEDIGVLNIYNYDPPDLRSKSKIQPNNGSYYFLCWLERQCPNSEKVKRTTPRGSWRITGNDTRISVEGRATGLKKTLVFHNGRGRAAERTGWVMYEYRLENSLLSQSNPVFCVIKYKETPVIVRPRRSRTDTNENNSVAPRVRQRSRTRTDEDNAVARRIRHRSCTRTDENNAVENMSAEAGVQHHDSPASLPPVDRMASPLGLPPVVPNVGETPAYRSSSGQSEIFDGIHQQASSQLQDSPRSLTPIDHTASPLGLPAVVSNAGEIPAFWASSRLSEILDSIPEDNDVPNINEDLSGALDRVLADSPIADRIVQLHHNKHTRPKPLEEAYVASCDSETETETDSTDAESYQDLSTDSDEVSTKQKLSRQRFFLLIVLVLVLLSCLLRLAVYIPKMGVIEHGSWLYQSSLGDGSNKSLEFLPWTLRRTC